MARVVEGKGTGSGYLWAALHGHTRLLKSFGRDHAEPLEVGPRTGSRREGGRSAAPGRQGSPSRACCELAKWRLPGRSERALGASVLTFETLGGRTGPAGAERGAGEVGVLKEYRLTCELGLFSCRTFIY